MITLALAAPLVLIAALEIVYRQSARHSGLADVVSDGYIRFTWIYIPTLVFVSVATLFNMLQFEIQVLQPYHALRVGKLLLERAYSTTRSTKRQSLYCGILSETASSLP
jgi:hypothetical protein